MKGLGCCLTIFAVPATRQALFAICLQFSFVPQFDFIPFIRPRYYARIVAVASFSPYRCGDDAIYSVGQLHFRIIYGRPDCILKLSGLRDCGRV
ncbi:unnamed protein product [Protopolystoma xenopodis]|uniref:Uncharacterized protein n=1 Tax=Protopolystoma xenopodis TaxID=117903 RepID=A0A448WGY4_9PLAT|nr:unnamed protein product [Protopolystoma xenopodis]